jgi:hypothetical protein
MIQDPGHGRDALARRSAALIQALAQGGHDHARRDALLVDLARWQAAHVTPYGRLVRARGIDLHDFHQLHQTGAPALLPAVPTDVFRMARVAAHPPELDTRTFLTSGTTSGSRGAHHLRDLSLYDLSARAAAAQALFPDVERMTLISLVAPEYEAPESSLSYMVARFHQWFGTAESVHAWHHGALDLDRLAGALDDAVVRGAPVALLGTSFAFVYAEDGLNRQWRLPAASRIMQTGGFKGRSREVAPEAMRALLQARYGVPEALIVAEYGMCELSSQLYETSLVDALAGRAAPRRLCPPAWVRASIVDPDTLAPVVGDAVGLVRIDDAANIDTAWAVQTSDLGRRAGDGLVLLGRAAGATPRGCSLAVEEALGTVP